jgi:hypothetical protein
MAVRMLAEKGQQKENSPILNDSPALDIEYLFSDLDIHHTDATVCMSYTNDVNSWRLSDCRHRCTRILWWREGMNQRPVIDGS